MGIAAVSMIIPGLGQHIQGRHLAGYTYEGIILASGIASMITYSSFKSALEDYNDARESLEKQAKSSSEYSTLLAQLKSDQDSAFDKAKSARTVTLICQVLLGTVWMVNIADAAMITPEHYSSGIALEPVPADMGAQIVMKTRF